MNFITGVIIGIFIIVLLNKIFETRTLNYKNGYDEGLKEGLRDGVEIGKKLSQN